MLTFDDFNCVSRLLNLLGRRKLHGLEALRLARRLRALRLETLARAAEDIAQADLEDPARRRWAQAGGLAIWNFMERYADAQWAALRGA